MVSKSLSNSLRLLSAELFVIVAGVLIALAIDEWRQNIENEDLEHEYVQQLIIDLRATEESVTKSETHASAGNESLSKLVDAFKTDESIDSDQLFDLIYASSSLNNPVPILGTIDTLVATGDLRLIRDSRTRSAVIQYLSYARNYLITPIYDAEERFGDNFHQLLTLAAADGMVYSEGQYGLSRNIEPNVEAFLANRQAYVIVLQMIDLRGHFTWHRDQLYVTAKELRERLEIGSN